jgi:NAD(P)-dependent dehydrogenase (short-subunit alcohol dehydrogenase family)
MQTLNGRVAIVTGAASGIGLAIAGAFAAEGARVVMADIDGGTVEARAEEVRARGAEVRALALDVRDPDAVERAGHMAVEAFGALHVAVNNAGIVNRGLCWELSLDEWQRVLDVNLWGVIHGVRSFVPRILASGEDGHVVNVSSLAALLPVERLGPYTVAKHGVLGLSDALRADLAAIGAPIGVSVVMPGLIRTGMNPFGTVAPETVAANVLDAMRANRDYVFTDDHATKEVEARLEKIIESRRHVRA